MLLNIYMWVELGGLAIYVSVSVSFFLDTVVFNLVFFAF